MPSPFTWCLLLYWNVHYVLNIRIMKMSRYVLNGSISAGLEFHPTLRKSDCISHNIISNNSLNNSPVDTWPTKHVLHEHIFINARVLHPLLLPKLFPTSSLPPPPPTTHSSLLYGTISSLSPLHFLLPFAHTMGLIALARVQSQHEVTVNPCCECALCPTPFSLWVWRKQCRQTLSGQVTGSQPTTSLIMKLERNVWR